MSHETHLLIHRLWEDLGYHVMLWVCLEKVMSVKCGRQVRLAIRCLVSV